MSTLTYSQMFYLQPTNAGGEAAGPFTFGQLRSMWDRGQVTVNTLYWTQANNDWRALGEVRGDLETSVVPPLLQPPPIRRPPVFPGRHLGHVGGVVSQAEETPSGYAAVLMISLLLPIVGVIAGIVYLTNPKHRSCGAILFVLSIVSFIIWYAVLAGL